MWPVKIGCLRVYIIRDRYPGHGPQDPAVPVQEIWDGDRDSNSKFAGFLGAEFQDSTNRNCPGVWKIRDSVPGTEDVPGHGPGLGPVPTPI